MTKQPVKKVRAKKGVVARGARNLVAAGLLAAAIGGVYLLNKKKVKKAVKSTGAWILRAKADVMEEVEKIPEISKEAYEEIVNTVMKHYGKMKQASKSELAGLKKDLESQWKNVVKDVKKK